MLVIRTNHDRQTNYLYIYTEPLIKEAEARGFRVEKIEGSDINFENIDKRIKKGNFQFIFFNGHGSESSFFNNHEKEFIGLDSAHLLRGTITFARACNSLRKLGVESIKKGCHAFVGYKNKFWLATHHPMECTPERDTIAKKIIECSNVIVQELLKGKTVGEAVNKSHEYSLKIIFDLIYSKEPLFSPALQAVMYNDDSLGFEGKSEAKLIIHARGFNIF